MNKKIFNNIASSPATVINDAGGKAYAFSAKHELAQYAMTGTFHDGYYTTAEAQTARLLELCKQCDPNYIAKLALYSREKGKMKDMPVFLLAWLSNNGDITYGNLIAPNILNNGKQVRKFVQCIRSGVTGRKSLGSAPKRWVKNYFASLSAEQVFMQSVGSSPTMGQVIALAHPRPTGIEQDAVFEYLRSGKSGEKKSFLPQKVRDYVRFLEAESDEVPEVPFEMLMGLPLSKSGWQKLARNCTWNQLKKNLNTFQRHGAFEDKNTVEVCAAKLANPELVRSSKIFPHELLVAYRNTTDVPAQLREALQDAMEVAVENARVPPGKRVAVFPDASGSMSQPATGDRRGSVLCHDVAALIASVYLRRSADTLVIPFGDHIPKVDLNPRDSIMTNASKLMNVRAGGTDCSLPLAEMNREELRADLLIYVSDNESWIERTHSVKTGTKVQWEVFKRNNPGAKLVCIDLVPNGTTQVSSDSNVLNVGGFSDAIFDTIADFALTSRRDYGNVDSWVAEIERTTLSSHDFDK